MNFSEWYEQEKPRFHSGHMNTDEIAYSVWVASAEPLLKAMEDIIDAVDEDPSLQEQLLIGCFGDDTDLPFAKAIRNAAHLIVARRTE